MPTRRARFCCEELKEYKVLDKAIHGIRRSESSARAKRYTETDPIVCRIYNKKDHVNVILPILSWTDEDVRDFIEYRGIKCAPVYYDEQGKFHVERRLGCLGCPMQSDNGVKDFKEHPLLFKAICKAALVWWHNHPDSNSRKKFGSFYGMVAQDLFYDSYEEWRLADKSDLFGTKTDWKSVLEKQFNIALPDENAD